MRLPPSLLQPPHLASQLAATLAALVVSTTQPLPLQAATPPSSEELVRLSEGLARMDYLLDHWDAITTVCTGGSSEAGSSYCVDCVAASHA